MSTVVNQGTTIDNLDPIEGTAEEKATFIAAAVLPIRGTLNGTKKTFKVTGSDLAASGENKIDSISVNGTAMTPDANKNVNIDLTGKADKVQPAAAGNLAKLDSNGNLADSGVGYSDVVKYSKITPNAGILVGASNDVSLNIAASGGVYLDAGQLAVRRPVPNQGTNTHRGHVLSVDSSDNIVWAEPAGGGGIPDPTGVTNGYVLTASNGAATWAAPGGGGSSNVEQINMICLKNQSTAGKTVIQSVSMTPKQALQSYNSGKTLILNVIVKTNLSSDEIWEQYTYPLSYLGYGWDEQANRYYILYFDYISALEGTGASLWNGVKGKLDTTDGTWEISSPSDN